MNASTAKATAGAWSSDLDKAYRVSQIVGIALGFLSPLIIAGLLLSRTVPPGQLLPTELVQQVGYLFTGLVFLAGAWAFWRSGRVLSDFRRVDARRRPEVLLRTCVLFAALSELSCILGLVYWILAGAVAGRHAWGFILLSPLLFLGVVPRKARWKKALEG
jgi:F0F1-type ATP synthase membrane subunit c/vacuolar-type H+-ATPase subunit K